MPDPKENRKLRVEMISKSHREGDIQTLAKAIVNLYDVTEDLERKLENARRKIKELEAKINELGG
jgi:phage shock protein A